MATQQIYNEFHCLNGLTERIKMSLNIDAIITIAVSYDDGLDFDYQANGEICPSDEVCVLIESLTNLVKLKYTKQGHTEMGKKLIEIIESELING